MKRYFTALLSFMLLTLSGIAQTTATEWFNKGIDLNKDKKYSEGAKAFEKAIALDKNYSEAFYRAGWTYNELAQYDMAIEKLNAATKLKEDYAFALQELGYAYKMKMQYNDALFYLNKAITVNSSYATAYKQRGDVNIKLKKDADAIADYEKAYLYDNTNEGACYELGYWNNGQKNFDKALEWLNKAIALKPKTSTYNEIGFAYYSLKKNDEAIAAYKKALQLDPLNGTGYKGIGDVYRRNYSPARIPEAMENYRQAIKNNPKSAGSYFGLGWCFNEKSNFDSSIIMLKKSLDLDNTLAAGYTELGYAQYMKGYNSDALNTFNRGLVENPKGTLPIYYKGLVYYEMKDKANLQAQYNALKDLDAALAAKLLIKINALQ